MEPTIYKPSIYNGAGIYKTGAEGGGGASGSFTIPYKTNFFDFDVNDGIDTPILGNRTPYKSNNVSISKISGGGIKITSDSTNSLPNNYFCFFHYLEDVITIETEFKLYPKSGSFYNFIQGSTFIISRENTKVNDIQFIVCQFITYQLYNGASFRTDDGLGNSWIELHVNADISHKAKIVFDKGTGYFYLDDTLYVTFDYGTKKIWTEKFTPDPRMSVEQEIYNLFVY